MSAFQIAVAGCGGMAQTWLEYAAGRPDAQIVALIDLSADAARATAEKFGLSCGIYADIGAALREAKPNLVFDVTIPKSHASVVIPALEAGCDVFGEKPMADSMKKAGEMASAAKRCGKNYFVMQNRRYNRGIRAFKQMVLSGAIGQPSFICADFFLGPHFGGFREAMDSPLILDMAIHTFDQARFISGCDPVSAYCHEFNPEYSWYGGNASAVCVFEMSGGAVFCYRGSWCAQGLNTSWESSWRVVGAKGTAIWDGEDMPRAQIALPGAEHQFIDEVQTLDAPDTWTGRDGHFGCLDEMFAALIEGRKAETDCSDNLKSMAMVYGAIQSAGEKRKVLL